MEFFTFKGRATRKEFILGFLGACCIGVILSLFLNLEIVEIIVNISILTFSVRRLHDLGKGGAFIIIIGILFLFRIHFLSLIVHLFLALVKGQEHHNKYGPNPYRSSKKHRRKKKKRKQED